MKFTRSIFLFTVLLCSCGVSTLFITQIDLDKYEKEIKAGMTQEAINDVLQRKKTEVEKNSLGRRIPDVIVSRPDGKKIELSRLIVKNTIIALTNIHCSWGLTGIEQDLPKATARLEESAFDFQVICIIIKDSTETTDSAQFNSVVNRLERVYPKIYIIEKTESDKLNVYANPTRLIVNNNKILEFIGIGVSTPDALFNELQDALMKCQ